MMPTTLYQWRVLEPGKKGPRILTWRMTEEDARTRYGDNARKIEGTLEVREPDSRAVNWAGANR